ncbi:MAG TPA: exopolysaccharide biosynthesis polyprenyl glycosylphosphotransferase [Devosia sp.]|jgi:putative colanic acid biosynthesis UDP-glucose lipid carrier transferase|uniref:exopolysaccharide biosynthesis polyprenyl glycosylphosphotransferase n=1 Tax=Devosia sp. TaxID=1871048 RepID=UPI002F93ADBE
MLQDSISYPYRDARRRRRYAFASRTVLACALSAIEGIACAGMLVITAWLFRSGTLAWTDQLVAAGIAGLVYAVLAFGTNRQALSYPGIPRYASARAVLGLLMSVATADLLYLASPGALANQMPLHWGELALSALVLVPLRLALYRRLSDMMLAGQLQIERIALVGRAEALQSFQSGYPVWQRGAQVVAMQAVREGAETVPADFVRTCIKRGCDSVLFVGDPADLREVSAVLAECRHYAINVMFAPIAEELGRLPTLLDILPFGPANSVRVLSKPLDDLDRSVKRLFDLALGSVMLVALLPLLLITALVVKLTSSGPVFYRQERRGFNGEVFWILKFRSMSVLEDGRAMTPARANDPRITPFGRFLRRTSIDELPQLLNVLRGDMSLVGPRPHALSDDAALAKRFAVYAGRQRIKPGITGWAQVNGYRGDTSTRESLEGRTLHDLHYVDHWSLGFDVRILFLTVFSRHTRQNAR